MDKEHIIDLVKENGEVHFVVEEHEAVTTLGGDDSELEYLGVRKGDNYSFEDSCIVIDTGSDEHHVPYKRIVYAEVPGGFPD